MVILLSLPLRNSPRLLTTLKLNTCDEGLGPIVNPGSMATSILFSDKLSLQGLPPVPPLLVVINQTFLTSDREVVFTRAAPATIFVSCYSPSQFSGVPVPPSTWCIKVFLISSKAPDCPPKFSVGKQTSISLRRVGGNLGNSRVTGYCTGLSGTPFILVWHEAIFICEDFFALL